MSSKRRKKKCRKFLDDFDESFFFVFFVRDLSFFLSFLTQKSVVLRFLPKCFILHFTA